MKSIIKTAHLSALTTCEVNHLRNLKWWEQIREMSLPINVVRA
jgi:hypothetical protein